MRILPVPVRDDNYAYLVIDAPSKSGVFVDPYTLSKAQDAAKQEGVQKVLGCITTHHHHDREFVQEAELFCARTSLTRSFFSSSDLPKTPVVMPTSKKRTRTPRSGQDQTRPS